MIYLSYPDSKIWRNTYEAYAPPFFWGPWVNVGSHAGDVWFSISYEELGDALAKGRVQYYDYDTKKQEIKEFWRSINIHTSDAYANVFVSFQSLGPTGVTVNVESNPYSPPKPEKPKVPTDPVIQQQEICDKFKSSIKWDFEYCVNIGVTVSGKPVVKITKIEPLGKYAWQYLIGEITDARVTYYSKEYKRIDIDAWINVKGKKNDFAKFIDESDGKNKVKVSPGREESYGWSIKAYFQNIELPGSPDIEVYKKYPQQSTFVYNGTVVDKPTIFVEK